MCPGGGPEGELSREHGRSKTGREEEGHVGEYSRGATDRSREKDFGGNLSKEENKEAD